MEWFRFRDLFEPCKRVDGLTNKLEAASLVKGFEDEILQLDISRMPYRDREDRIQFIFKAATLAVRHFPDKGREYWAMRLRALTWANDQIDRFGDDGPAKDPEMKARLEKERRENPLKYDREAERRRHEEQIRRIKTRQKMKQR